MNNCKLVVDAAVFCKDEILLVKYKDKNKYDHQSGWFIPDDLMIDYEHPDDTAKRILSEQLSLSPSEIKFDHFESFKGNDKSWHLIFHYKIQFETKPEISHSQEIVSFQWFTINNLPAQKDVAHHGWAIYTIKELLTSKG